MKVFSYIINVVSCFLAILLVLVTVILQILVALCFLWFSPKEVYNSLANMMVHPPHKNEALNHVIKEA